jgi:hypothetical protein
MIPLAALCDVSLRCADSVADGSVADIPRSAAAPRFDGNDPHLTLVAHE